MDFNDIPKNELDSGVYSDRTLSLLMDKKRKAYRAYIRSSANRNIPFVIGSFISACAMLAGYAMANEEGILIFAPIYLLLLSIWVPFLLFLPVLWFFRRPTQKELVEEIGWYRELLARDVDFRA